ncbi:dTMP kinase [Planctomicrobium sp. SH664]|uniref:dTMP kinase n=1 Tax=Planctomicrobium sp. SH664 TaxID=3448125 RepID=UPI003F5C7156
MSRSAELAPLIVFEGIDGAGKGTQSALFHSWLQAQQRNATLFSFPRYQETFFGARIGEFLNGDFGSLADLDPFLISLLYAGDRFESRSRLQAALQSSDVVICDRYIPSNCAHQSAKKSGAARTTLQQWIEHIEYGLYELPRPDLVFLFDIPVEHSQELIARKARRSYTDQQADLQEADTGYLAAVREVYLELAASRPNWKVIPIATAAGLRSVEEIQADVRAAAEPLLPRG